jgi:hypothetical protein
MHTADLVELAREREEIPPQTSLRDRSTSLVKALEEDRTAAVIRQVHELLVQLAPGGASRETLQELRSPPPTGGISGTTAWTRAHRCRATWSTTSPSTRRR